MLAALWLLLSMELWIPFVRGEHILYRDEGWHHNTVTCLRSTDRWLVALCSCVFCLVTAFLIKHAQRLPRILNWFSIGSLPWYSLALLFLASPAPSRRPGYIRDLVFDWHKSDILTRLALDPVYQVAFVACICLIVIHSCILIIYRRPRAKSGLCHECGYDLTGNISGVCPECGTMIPKRGSCDRPSTVRKQAGVPERSHPDVPVLHDLVSGRCARRLMPLVLILCLSVPALCIGVSLPGLSGSLRSTLLDTAIWALLICLVLFALCVIADTVVCVLTLRFGLRENTCLAGIRVLRRIVLESMPIAGVLMLAVATYVAVR
jgi:hypothetical protein